MTTDYCVLISHSKKGTRLIKGKPESFGWMRRKIYDVQEFEVWEQPSGSLVYHNVYRGKLMLVAYR